MWPGPLPLIPLPPAVFLALHGLSSTLIHFIHNLLLWALQIRRDSLEGTAEVGMGVVYTGASKVSSLFAQRHGKQSLPHRGFNLSWGANCIICFSENRGCSKSSNNIFSSKTDCGCFLKHTEAPSHAPKLHGKGRASKRWWRRKGDLEGEAERGRLSITSELRKPPLPMSLIFLSDLVNLLKLL